MNKDEKWKQLKMALTQRKPLKCYINDGDRWCFVGVMQYIQKEEIYQGQFGKLSMESAINIVNGLLPYIKLEVIDNGQ